jgi:hypothetical protein
MKNITVIVSLSLLLMGTQARADWVDDFMAILASSGVEPAVEKGLEAGVTPEDMVTMSQQAGEVEPAAVIKALYCAGVSSTTILAAADTAGVPESAVAAGYRQSVGQCAPAAVLNPDPFSRTSDIAAKGSPVGGGEPPETSPGMVVNLR